MDCASFERELAEVAAGESLDQDRRLRRLREHAGSCRECAGSTGLLEVLERPAGERELGDVPGDAYWAAFGGRVRRRIEGHSAASGSKSTNRSRAAVAAAVVGLALLGVWAAVRGPGAPAIVEAQPGPVPPAEPLPGSAEFDAWAPAEVWASWAETLGDERGPWDAAGPFPDVSDLDDDTRQALLRWLNGQNS